MVSSMNTFYFCFSSYDNDRDSPGYRRSYVHLCTSKTQSVGHSWPGLSVARPGQVLRFRAPKGGCEPSLSQLHSPFTSFSAKIPARIRDADHDTWLYFRDIVSWALPSLPSLSADPVQQLSIAPLRICTKLRCPSWRLSRWEPTWQAGRCDRQEARLS